MPLTDLKIRQLKPAAAPFCQCDGSGLFIEVRPGGSRLWRLAYRFGGKQKLLALGSYPETPLARARQLRQDARSQLQAGRDPAAEAKAAAKAERAITEDTFSWLAEELLAKQEREGKAAATRDKKRWLVGLAAIDLGDRPIRSITAVQILKPLKLAEASGTYETARLRGALVTPKTSHRAAVTEQDGFAGLVRAVWGYQGAVETQAALTCFLYSKMQEQPCSTTARRTRSRMARHYRSMAWQRSVQMRSASPKAIEEDR